MGTEVLCWFLGTPSGGLEIQNLGVAQLRSHDVIDSASFETCWHLQEILVAMRLELELEGRAIGRQLSLTDGPKLEARGYKLPGSGLLVVVFFQDKLSPSHDLKMCAKPNLFRTLRVCSKRCTTASCLSSWQN